MLSEVTPFAVSGKVTESGTTADPPDASERLPVEGVIVIGNCPDVVAAQRSEAPLPDASTVSSIVCVEEGASVALGSTAVIGRGGIQSSAATGPAPAPSAGVRSASAKVHVGKKRGPACADPPMDWTRTRLLISRS